MCCLALSAGFIGPRFALLLWWIFGDKVDAATSSFIWPFLGLLFLPWTTLAYVLAWGPLHGVSGLGWLARRSRSVRGPRDVLGALRQSALLTRSADRRRPGGGRARLTSSRVAVAAPSTSGALPRAGSPRSRRAAGPRRSRARRTPGRGRGRAPSNAQSVSSRSASVAIPRPRAAGTTQHPTSPTRCSPGATIALAEVGVARPIGDHDMKQPALAAALLVELDHAGAVGRRQRGYPARRSLVVLELERGAEIVLPERAQDEVAAGERWRPDTGSPRRWAHPTSRRRGQSCLRSTSTEPAGSRIE